MVIILSVLLGQRSHVQTSIESDDKCNALLYLLIWPSIINNINMSSLLSSSYQRSWGNSSSRVVRWFVHTVSVRAQHDSSARTDTHSMRMMHLRAMRCRCTLPQKSSKHSRKRIAWKRKARHEAPCTKAQRASKSALHESTKHSTKRFQKSTKHTKKRFAWKHKTALHESAKHPWKHIFPSMKARFSKSVLFMLLCFWKAQKARFCACLKDCLACCLCFSKSML